jgi:hypothetical protein
MGVSGVDFGAAVWGSEEIRKILKKEAKKGESSIRDAIRNYHLAHTKAKEAIAQALSQELGVKVEPGSEMVETAVNALSLTKIFKGKGEEEELIPALKGELQKFEVDSPEAHQAVASLLSVGSAQRVPTNEKVVQFDLDVIALKTVRNSNLLF